MKNTGAFMGKEKKEERSLRMRNSVTMYERKVMDIH